jgi:Protein of unknown function (DUF4245)
MRTPYAADFWQGALAVRAAGVHHCCMAEKKSRLRLGARDMVLSMGLVAIIVAVSLIFTWKQAPEPIREVKYGEVVTAAREAAPYEVLGPEGLPARWRATSANVRPQPDGTFEWRVGFVTPDDRYAAVVQRGNWPEGAQKGVEAFLKEVTRQGKADATPSWVGGGRTWQRLNGLSEPDEKRALVLNSGSVTTVVHGSAEWDELQRLAASLG